MPEARCPGWMKVYRCETHDLTWSVGGGPRAMPCPYCEQARAQENLAEAEAAKTTAKRGRRFRGSAPHLPDQIP
jgi:hypothetical protein